MEEKLTLFERIQKLDRRWVYIVVALAIIIPLYVTVSMAFKTTKQAVDGNAFSLPNPFSGEGFVEAWNLTNFPKGALISFVVTACTVIFTVLLAAMLSYAVVRNWDRKFFRYSFFYLMAVMFIPFPVVALPQIQMTGRLHLDNPGGVIWLATMFQMAFSVSGAMLPSPEMQPAAPFLRPCRMR